LPLCVLVPTCELPQMDKALAGAAPGGACVCEGVGRESQRVSHSVLKGLLGVGGTCEAAAMTFSAAVSIAKAHLVQALMATAIRMRSGAG
jgi:hypothetical protein